MYVLTVASCGFCILNLPYKLIGKRKKLGNSCNHVAVVSAREWPASECYCSCCVGGVCSVVGAVVIIGYYDVCDGLV